MRLDLYLCERGLADSRTAAKSFILSGAVKVDGKTVTKPAYSIESDDIEIEVDTSSRKYVSRGGLKLEAALDAFDVRVEGRLAIDIGASSGGFTDCLIKHGAAHVIAVDSGTSQLSPSLAEHPLVTSLENYNARYMKREELEYVPDLAVMDVSFISATYIIPAIYDCLDENSDFICLIKPQFEVGKSNIGKGGIVKNESARRSALNKVVDFAGAIGFQCIATITSPITGGDGNIEFLAHFKK